MIQERSSSDEFSADDTMQKNIVLISCGTSRVKNSCAPQDRDDSNNNMIVNALRIIIISSRQQQNRLAEQMQTMRGEKRGLR